MKMNIINFILYWIPVILLFGIIDLYSQDYETISEEKIQEKITELKNSNYKDTILFSTIGFFREERIRFSRVVENTLYVSEKGIYYRMDFADDIGNVTVSCTFFQPHIRFVPIPLEERDSTYNVLMNEHICRCESLISYPVIKKQGREFVCGGLEISDEEAENYSIDCYDLRDINFLISNFYNKGEKIKNKIKIEKEVTVLKLE